MKQMQEKIKLQRFEKKSLPATSKVKLTVKNIQPIVKLTPLPDDIPYLMREPVKVAPQKQPELNLDFNVQINDDDTPVVQNSIKLNTIKSRANSHQPATINATHMTTVLMNLETKPMSEKEKQIYYNTLRNMSFEKNYESI